MTKKVEKHFKERLRQRFRLKLNNRVKSFISNEIKKGRAEKIELKSPVPGQGHYIVHYKNYKLRVVYNELESILITVLYLGDFVVKNQKDQIHKMRGHKHSVEE